MCLLWRSMGRIYPDWEENQYLQHFRVSKDSFWYLCQTYGKYFKKQTTHLRRPLPPPKRLAIVLHWLAQANSYSELAAMYAIGKSTVVAIAHEGIAILRERLVPETILFPTGRELDQVMVDFEACVGCHVAVEPWMVRLTNIYYNLGVVLLFMMCKKISI